MISQRQMQTPSRGAEFRVNTSGRLRKGSQNGIDLVIIAGDLFETHTPEPALIEHVLSKLRQLDNAGIPVITVPGNHDEITYHNSVYRQYGTGRTWPGICSNPMPELVFRHEIKGVPVFIYSLLTPEA